MNGHTLKVAAFYGDFADTQMAQVHTQKSGQGYV